MKTIEKGRVYVSEDGQTLRFHSAKESGAFSEDIIDILVDRLLSQQEVLADGFTDRAVTHLLRAKAQLVQRLQIRSEYDISGKPIRTESVLPAVKQAEEEAKRVAEREAR